MTTTGQQRGLSGKCYSFIQSVSSYTQTVVLLLGLAQTYKEYLSNKNIVQVMESTKSPHIKVYYHIICFAARSLTFTRSSQNISGTL